MIRMSSSEKKKSSDNNKKNDINTERFVDAIVNIAQAIESSPKSKNKAKTGLAFADPSPIGLAGFALTTIVLSVFNANIIDPKKASFVVPLAITYGGITQWVAGIFEVMVDDAFAATAFMSYGAFWCAYAALVGMYPGLSQDDNCVGLFLLVWLIFSFYMFIVSFGVSKALFIIFFFLVLSLLCQTIGKFAVNENATKAGGWLGIICASIAWYCSFSKLIKYHWGHDLLPLGEGGFINMSWFKNLSLDDLDVYDEGV